MADQGKHGITWCERTWNPVTGCSAISEGCANCYAKRQALRLQKMGLAKYANGFKPTFHPSALNDITPRQKRKLYFVCSMGDLFHEKIFDREIKEVFQRMAWCYQHRFMVLTKRSLRMYSMFLGRVWRMGFPLQWPVGNVALGVTAENQMQLMVRLSNLRHSPAAFRYLSIEPMLGPIELNEADPYWDKYIDLVIVGGETGPGAREIYPSWVRTIRDDCAEASVPFHFKKWGPRVGSKVPQRLLDGVEYNGSINWRA